VSHKRTDRIYREEKHRRTRLFVLTLGHSRKSVRFLTFRSSARIWAELHEKHFAGWAEPRASLFLITCVRAY
jgi:hypothetical protein